VATSWFSNRVPGWPRSRRPNKLNMIIESELRDRRRSGSGRDTRWNSAINQPINVSTYLWIYESMNQTRIWLINQWITEAMNQWTNK
jgi:hypothetical protein